MRKLSFTILASVLLFWGCEQEIEKGNDSRGKLVQISVIDALLQGIYDGILPIGQLTEYGDFGIGTFDGLDGEMVVFNDTVFQVVSTGKVNVPSPDVLTPFAAVTKINADTSFSLSSISYTEIKENFNSYFPTPNIFYVVKIHGKFSYMKTRSVPKQSKPYPPLAEVTALQPEFEFENVTGDIIGFFCPEYAKGINVTGLHLHFLTNDRKGGGHIIDFKIEGANMELGYLFDYRLILPQGGDFFGGDFTVDRSKDLENAEN
jgi:acetolactate decarboxylase